MAWTESTPVRGMNPSRPRGVGRNYFKTAALMALLINACEAMENGGTITVRTRTWEGGEVLEVEDNGPGMPPDVAARAFEPFFTTKNATSGVGLGLAVVYGIVRRHGGRVELKTAPGQGCRFTIYLSSTPPESMQEGAS